MENSERTILIVDDNSENLSLLMRMLWQDGFRVLAADSGAQTLEIIEQTRPDLFLIDIMMPGMDGFELTRKIRESSKAHDTPVIMVTSLTGKEDRLKSVEAGANDFISKPVDRVELRVRMRSLLKMKEAQDSIKRHKAQLEDTVRERTAELVNKNKLLEKEIEERKNAQHGLMESEERFRAVIESAEDLIFVKDKQLRYTHVNGSMLRFLEMEYSDILGKTDRELFGATEGKRFENAEKRTLKGQVVQMESEVEWNGKRNIFHFSRAPLKDPAQVVTGLCCIARDVSDSGKFGKIAGEERATEPADVEQSASMKSVLEQIRVAAKTDSMCLFLGESGVGKDYMARFLHEHSHRSGGPFFSINCAAVAAELAESELFGHEAGAFTGATRKKRGLLELAEGGTLLLNEIGELTPALQAKLLTFLDTESFTRVGGEKTVTVNARLVAATNRDLEKEALNGRFRQDLYYRLNVIRITIPPLRERTDELPGLIKRFMDSLSKKMGRHEPVKLEPEAMDALISYGWPGNIRELHNILERAMILSGESLITREALGLAKISRKRAPVQGEDGLRITLSKEWPLDDVLTDTKRFLITEALKKTDGSIKEAASLLGLTRNSLSHHMRRLDLKRK
jgi:PAS domain S-box-containing protein